VQLDGVTLEQALNQILSANQLFYKVINERTIMVIPDTPPKRAQYEEQVIRTFFISHVDATELAQLINTIIRVPSMAVQPMIAPNKTANTITIRATANVASIIEKVIEANDNPRAEIIVDVQILEVNRNRAKTFGIDLSNYTPAIRAIFSPEVDPRGTSQAGTGSTQTTTNTFEPIPFNVNTITRGFSTADFYLSIPSAALSFLESDTQTRLIAKPQLRGAEGEKLTLNLGDEIPVPSTVFTPFAQGGANVNPLTSFNYKPVGVNITMTPRVTFEGEIILDLEVESSTIGRDVNIAGQNLPAFGSRKVKTKIRLRDGESNLLAGLLREDERRSLQGIPGIVRVPILRQLFAANNNQIAQTDIVMLLTPRVVRSHELSQQDVSPIYIGTQQNLGLGGPPPLIAGPPPPDDQAAPPAQPAPGAPPGAPGQAVLPPGTAGVPIVPPGSGQIPGTTTVPAVPTPVPAQPAVPPAQPPPGAPPGTTPTPPAPAQPAPPVQPPAPPPAGAAQILVTPPGTEFRVGGGPYTVPVSITGASRVSSVTLTITFNPAVLRVRSVQEGSFMRQGGTATFTQQVDTTAGRVDIAIARTADATGVSGAGLLAAILFDAIAPGAANISVAGMATAPGGAPVPLQFAPVGVTVR
jgi:Flp pilus assembly secretin CpaC